MIPVLFREYRWSRIANMLFIEQPVGVGFSYASGDEATQLYSSNNDTNSAERNLLAINKFYQLYPEYAGNEFYITGESYAGVYVPSLAYDIVTKTTEYTGPKLTGIAVGNGCTGYETGICGWYYTDVCAGFYYEWQFFLDTAFVNNDLRTEVEDACDWTICTNSVTTTVLGEKCLNLVQNVSNLVGYINAYNIYGECLHTSCQYTSSSSSQEFLSVMGLIPPSPVNGLEIKEATLSGKAGPLRRPFTKLHSTHKNRLRVSSISQDDDGYLQKFTDGFLLARLILFLSMLVVLFVLF